MYQDGGGSNALRGFVYQFLHTLLTVLEQAGNVRVCCDGTGGEEGAAQDLLFRIEAPEAVKTLLSRGRAERILRRHPG